MFRISPDEPWRIIRTRWRVSGAVKGVVEGGGRVSGYFTGATGTTVYRGDAYPPEFLWTCTLVTTGEPCAMCTGTLYWANIGRLVYGYEEAKLFALTGDHPANPTINLPSRTVLAAGQKKIEVHGPFPELEDELLVPHRDFWTRAEK